MPRQARSTDGGLSTPSIRPGSGQSANSGTSTGDQEHPVRVEVAPREDSSDAVESKPAEPERIGGFPTADPFSAPVGNDRPRRGRPKGWKKQQQAKESPGISNLGDLARVEKLLIGLTYFTGGLVSTPELRMSEDEAKGIREALQDISKLYTIPVTDKFMAWSALGLTVGGYAFRVYTDVSNRPKPTKVVNIRAEEPEQSKPETKHQPDTPYPPAPFVFNDGVQEE